MVARRSASSEFLGATATGLIVVAFCLALLWHDPLVAVADRKSTRLNSSHSQISYAVFCLKKKNQLSTTSAVIGTAPYTWVVVGRGTANRCSTPHTHTNIRPFTPTSYVSDALTLCTLSRLC